MRGCPNLAKLAEVHKLFLLLSARNKSGCDWDVLPARFQWVRLLQGAESFCRAAAILRGTEPVSALTRALFILLRSL